MTKLQREIDRVDAAQDKHEAECALRYGELNASIRDLKDGMKWVIRLGAGIAFSLMSWMAVQLWDHTQADIEAARYEARAPQ
ncbi:MAG: hypothetical protein ACK4FB_08220 [Brevundimonas sp.]|uniref:hypothetical protein n=1 Tax=Brevundimonas sp. TaxID=1871086 RepID=UPI00391DD630